MKNLARRSIKAILRRRWRTIAAPYASMFEGVDAENLGGLERIRQAEEGPVILWPPRKVQPGPVRRVIVSPHLDDAALSLGGHMLRWGGECLVLDLFSKTAWWRFGAADLTQIQACRDAEEDLMAELTGVAVRRIGLPEALGRGYSMEQVFTANILSSDQVGQSVRLAIKALVAEGDFEWHLPMGVGNHIDHRIARDEALAALNEAGVKRILFYEDQPYAAENGMIASRAFDTPLKIALMKVYWSQLTLSQIVAVGKSGERSGPWNNRYSENDKQHAPD